MAWNLLSRWKANAKPIQDPRLSPPADAPTQTIGFADGDTVFADELTSSPDAGIWELGEFGTAAWNAPITPE